MSGPTSRRTLLCGLAMLPAMPGGVALAAHPSSLAQACLWAVERREWIDTTARSEGWNDERLDEEIDKVEEIFTRLLTEPSVSLADLNAKAQLALEDLLRFAQPFDDPADNAPLDRGEQIAVTVLREVIALCA